MHFTDILESAKKKIDNYMDMMEEVSVNPDIIMNTMFEEGSSNLLTKIIECSHELTGQTLEVHDLQDSLYEILIPHLSEKFKNVTIIYEKDMFPSPLWLFNGEDEIGRVNLYEKTFTIVPNKDLRLIHQRIVNMEQEQIRIAEELINYESYQKTPKLYAKTPMDVVKITMKPKHYKEKIKQEYKDLVSDSIDTDRQILSIKLELENLENYTKEGENVKYSIAENIKNMYNYQVFIEGLETNEEG